MRRSNATTLQDVARDVGVTAMTVSVVLNGGRSATRVSEKTRARILESAARLRYRPNAVARGLSRQRMDTLGVVAVIDGGEINLYFLEVLNGILEGATAHGQNTTIFSVSDWTDDEHRILQFCDGRVDGMIFIGSHLTGAFAETLAHHTALVTIHNNGPLRRVFNLDVDSEGGAYRMVRHLIERGHRRIAHLAGGSGQSGAQRRLAGYRRALEEAGLPYDESLVVPGSFSAASGRQQIRQLLAARPTPQATAIFCANDSIAYGCMEVLAEKGLRVPDDFSVVGFDDTFLAQMTAPPLTTVRQPFRQMGRRSVDLLLSQIRGADGEEPTAPGAAEDTAAPDTEILPVDLVVRGSAGPPRAASSAWPNF